MSDQLEDLLSLKRRIAERVKRAIESGCHTRKFLINEIHEKFGLKMSTAYSYLKGLEKAGDPAPNLRGDNKYTPKRVENTRGILLLLGVREDDILIEDLNRYSSSSQSSTSAFGKSDIDAELPPPSSYPADNNLSNTPAQINNGTLTRGGYIVPETTPAEIRFLDLLEEAEKFYPERSAETFFQGVIKDYYRGNREQRRRARRELVKVIRANRKEQKVHERKVT